MRIGIVVDSTCDLPRSYFQTRQVQILPITVHLGGDRLVDERDPEATLYFYSEQLDSKGIDAHSSPYSVEAIQKVFLERLVVEFDYVFCITVSNKRSPIYENARKASFKILSQYRGVRKAAGVSGHFSMRVIDSKTIFAGTAVLTAEAVRLAEQGVHPSEIRTKLESLVPYICGYMVPADLAYVRDRGFKKGERKDLGDLFKAFGLTLGSALAFHPIIRVYDGNEGPAAIVINYEKAVERMMLHIAEQVRGDNLMSQQVCLSYAGDPARVYKMPGYLELKQATQEKGADLLVAMMSATGAVNVGSGCLFAAYLGEMQSI